MTLAGKAEHGTVEGALAGLAEQAGTSLPQLQCSNPKLAFHSPENQAPLDIHLWVRVLSSPEYSVVLWTPCTSFCFLPVTALCYNLQAPSRKL